MIWPTPVVCMCRFGTQQLNHLLQMLFSPESDADQFLAQLRAAIRRTGNWQTDEGWEGSEFVERVTWVPDCEGLSETGVELTIRWSLDGILQPIESIPSSDASSMWKESLSSFLRQIDRQAKDPHRKTFLTRHTFAYIGRNLDGQYRFDHSRIVPAVFPDEKGILLERIIFIDVEAEGTDQDQAHWIGSNQAIDIIGLLSVLLGIGFYRIRHEARWVLENGKAVRRYLGFHTDFSHPERLPSADSTCPAGTWENEDRAQFSPYRAVRNSVKLPSDTADLFKRFEILGQPDKDQFRKALRLYRTGAVVGATYPSVRMAYQVAAVEALKEPEEGSRQGFLRLVEAHCPQALAYVKQNDLYGRFRSAHLHSGEFHGGEYSPSEPGPLWGRIDKPNPRVVDLYIGAMSSTVLTRWLLQVGNSLYRTAPRGGSQLVKPSADMPDKPGESV